MLPNCGTEVCKHADKTDTRKGSLWIKCKGAALHPHFSWTFLGL